ncbi:hypothetical protein Ahy_A07g036723 [Arachis hypogaea]|uniref:Uncharacterized protein n=1 Tax=Arachis hypogaea TaxID=3818 RepID=A0A445CGT7_ARAHY|nr:hypothetical protein Ahy_A07g036723 [Arachis hypogaea]
MGAVPISVGGCEIGEVLYGGCDDVGEGAACGRVGVTYDGIIGVWPGEVACSGVGVTYGGDGVFGETIGAAFLSALVGSEVVYSAAQAAVTTLSEAYKTTKNHRSFPKNTSLQEAGIKSNGGTSSDSSQASRFHANILLEKEELDVEKAISEIIGLILIF